jgi:hypothetical protein
VSAPSSWARASNSNRSLDKTSSRNRAATSALAAFTTLLADSRSGGRGEILPWAALGLADGRYLASSGSAGKMWSCHSSREVSSG